MLYEEVREQGHAAHFNNVITRPPYVLQNRKVGASILTLRSPSPCMMSVGMSTRLRSLVMSVSGLARAVYRSERTHAHSSSDVSSP